MPRYSERYFQPKKCCSRCVIVLLSSFIPDKWSPALQIRTVLLSIQALLSAPNPDDPLANDVAELWKVNEAEAIRNAKEWTKTYAMGN